ncbi:unnamed protein product [Calicophoron daubneyi]|uniref:Uncharacterized protein n=1 Tax=Calicophoron daubneyi TaxID=300641 RepID=A0AAV2T8M1_CALDB
MRFTGLLLLLSVLYADAMNFSTESPRFKFTLGEENAASLLGSLEIIIILMVGIFLLALLQALAMVVTHVCIQRNSR